MDHKLFSKLSIPLLAIGLFSSFTASYFTSKAYAFERLTGGHYLGEVEPEIQGVYAHKAITPNDTYCSTQKSRSMNNKCNSLFLEDQNILKASSANENGNNIEKAMARYDYFINRSVNNANLLSKTNNTNITLWFISSHLRV